MKRSVIGRLFLAAVLSWVLPVLPDGVAADHLLPRSTPEAQGISSTEVRDFVRSASASIDSLHGFVLVRHGHVVAEGWWAPYDAETPHMLYSLSKSFTSTAVGLAIAEGKLSLEARVIDYFPKEVPEEPSWQLKAMRLRDLLCMSTGHKKEPSVFRGVTGDAEKLTWTKRFLSAPVEFKPGTHFLYNTAATYMQSAIVQKVTGQTVLDYLRPRLLDPLGFENPRWMESPEGVSVGGFGFFATTLEIARFGQVYLQKGKWKGKQLIPASWVEAATARQTSNGSNPNNDWDQGYGYQFWRSRHGYRGDGAFGQFCLVLPEQDAVVAITSGVGDMAAIMKLVWRKILPACRAEALTENPAAHAALTRELKSLGMAAPSGKPTSAISAKVSGKTYVLDENDLGLKELAIHFEGGGTVLETRTADGTKRTAIGFDHWAKSAKGFAASIDQALSVPKDPKVAARGAWTAGDVYEVRLVLPETPFNSQLKFRFEGDRVSVEAKQNAGFGAKRKWGVTGKAK
ncbi:MAG: serine hydrolase [Planctomycetota bacterium]